MTWTLNQLEKTVEQEFIPGQPGVPGDPGSPAVPGYSYTVTETSGGGQEITSLEPLYEQYVDLGAEGGLGYRAYRIFSGRKALLSGVLSDGEGDPLYIYTYETTTVTTTITVPAQPGVPPTPGIPPTPGKLETDFQLGWDAGALGPELYPGKYVTWRFSPGSVGAAVGVTLSSTPQGQTYREMKLAVLGMSGTFTVAVDGVSVTDPLPFTEDQAFQIIRPFPDFYPGDDEATDRVMVVVNGSIVASVALDPLFSDEETDGFELDNSLQTIRVDSSLYSGYDIILDAQSAELAEADFPINVNLGSASQSGAVAVPTVVVAIGPGTVHGEVGASSKSAAVVSHVLAGGSVLTWGAASSLSAGAAVPVAVPTFGPDTARGIAGATSPSAGRTAPLGSPYLSSASGGADLALQPIIGAGGAPGVAVGWTGDYPGAAAAMATLEVHSDNSDIIPYTAIGTAIMVPATMDGYGLTGETSVDSLGTMSFLLGLGSEGDYAQAELAMLPAFAYASEGEVAAGVAELSFQFTLYAVGLERDQNGGRMLSRNEFRVAAQGGGQASTRARLALEASGSGEGVGQMVGVIGYA